MQNFLKKNLSGAVLKWVALFSMTVDHAALCIIQNVLLTEQYAGVFSETGLHRLTILYSILRHVCGRLAFPIYAFLLVEGFFHTRNRRKYSLKLFLFSILSEIPFDIALFGEIIHPDYQNVFFTLFIGFCMMSALETLRETWHRYAAVILSMLFAFLLHSDYSVIGVFVILFFYLNVKDRKRQVISGLACLIWEPAALLSGPLLYFYNGKRGKQPGLFFYMYYPLHLALLAFFARVIM